MRICVALCASALAALPASSAAIDGYVLEQEIITRSRRVDGTIREDVKRKRVFLAGDRARLQDESGEALVVRLDKRLGGGGEVITLDDLLESYERTTFKALRRRWDSLNALILEQIESTPPTRPADRADLIEQLTYGEEKWEEIWKFPPGPDRERLLTRYALPPEPPEVKVRATDEKKTLLGFECVRYEASENDVVTDSAFIVPELRFDTRYYEFMELRGWIGKALAESLRRVKGLPLMTSQRYRTGVEIELRTKSIQEKALDSRLFEVPPGYTERKKRSTFR